MSKVLSDEHLVKQALLGQKQAFSLLVSRHQGMLRVMLRNLCGQPDIADDLAQQSFIAAWRKLSQFSGNSFRAWIGRIAFREFLMWKRKQKNEQSLDDEPSEATVSEVEKVGMQQALTQLNQNQREIITLSYFVGFTHGEISELTGMPLGTVKSHANRGMAKLRQILGGQDGE